MYTLNACCVYDTEAYIITYRDMANKLASVIIVIFLIDRYLQMFTTIVSSCVCVCWLCCVIADWSDWRVLAARMLSVTVV
uniref:Uncharacterized protein n=1 Tax=Rhipicephalus appendiculatus TaxID=34631 RepID=A0A131YDI1_RHIAP